MSRIRVLGIDPGFGRTGIGQIEIIRGDAAYVGHQVIETSGATAFATRLREMRNALRDVLRDFQPDLAAVEHLFFQTNAKTAMKVGMARGVILLALEDAAIPMVELTPSQVKSGITGFGNADKEQVQSMVVRILRLKETPKPDDAADALALAIVGGYMARTTLPKRG